VLEDFAHVILTRFNLPSAGAESYVRAKSGWLETRWELFERYCVPSVAMQTSREFRWIVYLDPDSPPWLKGRIAKVSSGGVFLPIYRAAVERRQLVDDIRGVTGRAHQGLLTTNLDNDDALAADFMERVEDAATRVSGRHAIYLSVGLIKAGGAIYRRVDRSNPFCSVREGWDNPVTCWSDWHNLLGRSMPVLEVDGRPGWLQVIHGTNVSNRVRGRRVSPVGHRTTFGLALDDIAPPGRIEIARDRVVDGPRRVLRETGRRAIKTVVIATVGKSGLDRVKEFRLGKRTASAVPRREQNASFPKQGEPLG